MLNIELIKKIKKKYNFNVGYCKKILELNNWNYNNCLKNIEKNKKITNNVLFYYLILDIMKNNKLFIIKINFNFDIIKNITMIENIKKKLNNIIINKNNIIKELEIFSIFINENIYLNKILIFKNKNYCYYNHKNKFFCLIKYNFYNKKNCCYIIFNKINFLKKYICKKTFFYQKDFNLEKNIKIFFIILIKNNNYFYYE